MFAYIICKIASIYNKAYVAIENNGVSFATLEYLWRDLEYDNIIHLGGNPKTSIGIVSSATSKFEACLNFKEIVENELRQIYIYDGRIIDEMERFEKHSRVGRAPTYAASAGHDDLMMSSIWAFYILKPNLLDNYYDIKQFAIDKLGNQIPLFITSFESISDNEQELKEFIFNLDQKFKNNSNKYEISFNQLEKNIKTSQEEILKQFVPYINNTNNTNNSLETNIDPDEDKSNGNFQFSGFIRIIFKNIIFKTILKIYFI